MPHPLIQPHIEKKTRQASRQAEAWRPRRSYPCGRRQTRTSKQDENDERPAPSTPSHGPRAPSNTPSHRPPRSPDKHTTRRTNETPEQRETTSGQDEHGDDENDGRTTGGQDEHGDDEANDGENAQTPQDDKQATRRNTRRRTTRRKRDDETHDDNGKSKQSGAKRGEREEQKRSLF